MSSGLKSESLLSALIDRIGVPIKRKTVTIGGIKTNYLEAGNGSPVILLHGGDAGAGGIRWMNVIAPLSRQYKVLIPDMPGYGESEKPWASYDKDYFADWLKLFVDKTTDEPIQLVAHSLGGAVAIQYAIKSPEKLKHLALINSAGLGKTSKNASIKVKISMILNNLIPTPDRSKWFLINQVLFDPESINQELLMIEAYSRAVIMQRYGKRVFWLGRGKAIIAFSKKQLSLIKCPTSIIWGNDDRNFLLSSAEEALKIIPHSELHVIQQAGHVCFFDRPEEFNSIIKSCLSQ